MKIQRSGKKCGFTLLELLISVCLLGLLTITLYRFTHRHLKVEEEFFKANQQKDMHLALKKMADDLHRASDMVKMKTDQVEIVEKCNFFYIGDPITPEPGLTKPIYFFSICHPHTTESLDPPMPLLYEGEGSRVLVAAVLTGRETIGGRTVGQIDYVRTISVGHPIFNHFSVSPVATDDDFLLRPLHGRTEIELAGSRPLLDLVSKLEITEIAGKPTLIGISIECSPAGKPRHRRTTLHERISVPINVETTRF